MAKTKISEYDSTAANNTDIDSINIAEGMAPSNVNNAIRQLMAHLKDMNIGSTMTMLNDTEEDTDGGRESTLIFKGEQSGGEVSTLAEIEASHDGTSDDEKGDLIFRTNDGNDGSSPTEAARIDSAQNFLVGKTVPSTDTAGITLNSNGAGWFTGDGIRPLLINRKTSDGDIVEFRKNGTKMGIIGVAAGDNLYIGSTAANHGGIYMNDTGVLPMSAGSLTDNTRDLGGASNRWNDIFLGGGAYLGGTTGSNYLEDYEEGTWTPSLRVGGSTTGITYTDRSGAYVKIGELVFVEGDIQLSNRGSNSGAVTIGALPFTVDDRTSGTSLDGGSSLCAFQSNTSGLYSPIGLIGSGGGTHIDMRGATTSGGDISSAVDRARITNTFSIRFSLTYRAT